MGVIVSVVADFLFTLLCDVWCAMVVVLLIMLLPPLRNKISRQRIEPFKHFINAMPKKSEKIKKCIKNMLSYLMISGVLCILICYVDISILKSLVYWLKTTMIMGFLPTFFSKTDDNKGKYMDSWNGICLILGVIASIPGYMLDTNSFDVISDYREMFIGLISSFVAAFILSLCTMFTKEKNINRIERIIKGIRNDLNWRTTNIQINNIGNEIAKSCEQFFCEYVSCLKKLDKIEGIEFVCLLSKYKKEWYNLVKKYIQVFMLLSIAIICIIKVLVLQKNIMFIIWPMIMFLIVVFIIIKVDKNVMYKIAIRFFYDDWGYCVYYKNKCKFVAYTQMLGRSKQHEYIYSFLDIVAFCRAVIEADKINKTQKIRIVSNNFVELFKTYDTLEREQKDWIRMLPLWAMALFEYKISKEVENDVKKVLKNSIKNRCEWAEVSIFLQSLLVDLSRKMPDESDYKLIYDFTHLIRI